MTSTPTFSFAEDTLLFVYGTLRSEFADNGYQRFLTANAQFLGKAWMQGSLYDLGGYPAVQPDGGEQRIWGEMYALPAENHRDMLHILDEYEGCNHYDPEFTRQKCPVKLANRTVNAWVYIYNQPTDHLPHIPGGDYVRYIHQKVRG